jgi:hypothetical protein
MPGSEMAGEPTPPAGNVYEWYRRGLSLLHAGSPDAAAQLLERVADAEPNAHSAREALGRAQYDSGRYEEAARSFASIVDENPVDDYARFGLGLAATRNGDLDTAVEHLAVAVALRPERTPYRRALRRARTRRDAQA